MNDSDAAKLQKMIKQAVEDGNEAAFMKVGIDLNDFVNVQKDIAFARKQREISEKITLHGRMVLMSLFFAGIVSTLFIGIKETLK